MACATISDAQDFVRLQLNKAIEQHRPLAPTTKTLLSVLLQEVADHVGPEELLGSKATSRTSFVLRLVVEALCERYSQPVVALALTLEA